MSPLERIEALTLILTSRCNMRCAYCYQSAKRPASASWRTIGAAIDLAMDGGRGEIDIGFCGGEPLLEFPLMRRAVARAEGKRPGGRGATYYISTNGTLLTEEIAAFLEEHRFETQISFDGVAAAQDLRGRGTFRTLDRLLARLRIRHAGFYESNVSIALTVTPRNLAQLAESVSYFLDMGASRIVIAPAIASDAEWSDDLMGGLDAQLASAFERSLAYYEETGEIPVQMFRGGDAPSSAPRGRPLCGAARAAGITVDVDGEVYGCSMFARSYLDVESPLLRACVEAMRLGRIDDPGLSRRLASHPAAVRRAGIFHRKDRKRSAHARCAECRYLDRCFVCPACIAFAPGNGDPDRISDFCCAFNQAALKYQDRFPREAAAGDALLAPPGAAAEMERWRILAGGAPRPA